MVRSARASYARRPSARVPLALADLHQSLTPGARVEVSFSRWPEALLRGVLVGAGFAIEAWSEPDPPIRGRELRVSLRRERTLPDTVGPDMRLLVVGLNPSLYSADAGVPFARPGNRFWPAAIAAGLADTPRSPREALRDHGMGMTDLVKRATRAASELHPDEYRDGMERLEHLVAWLQPGAVCIVGLSGWRAAVDRRAVAGVQANALGGRP